MIIRVELSGGVWSVSTEHCHLGRGLTRREAIREARRIRPEIMDHLPIQPEEIPDELREIATRMRAVGDAVASHKTYQPYHPTAAAMGRWADSVADWATNLEECAK